MTIKERDIIRYIVEQVGKINAFKARIEVLVEYKYILTEEEKEKYLKKLEDVYQKKILKYQKLLNLCLYGKFQDWKIS